MRELAAPEIEDLLYDPQTSGGLLISLPERDAAALERRSRSIPHRARDRARRTKPIRIRMTPKAMNNPIIIALDVESADEARALVRRIGPRVNFYKVGMELYAAAGIAISFASSWTRAWTSSST